MRPFGSRRAAGATPDSPDRAPSSASGSGSASGPGSGSGPGSAAELVAGPVWLDRLITGVERPAANRQPADDDGHADETLQVVRPRGPWGVGLRDSVASGWFDATTGALVPGVPIGPDDLVVDFGCGEGNLLSFCAGRGAAVIGIDNHQGTLDAAARRLAGSAVDPQLLLMAADGTVPLPDATATVVVCTEVLEHVPEPAAVLAELRRIARPGARLVLSVPSQESEELTRLQAPASYFQPPNHINVFSQQAFTDLITNAGLRIEAVHRLGFFWSVWFALQWHTGVDPAVGRHPVLDLWTATWDQLLSSPGGDAAKAALDDTLPKYQLVVATLPAS